MASYIGFRKMVPSTPSKKSVSSASKEDSLEHYATPTQKNQSFNRLEEERMKKQKKLSVGKMLECWGLLNRSLPLFFF